MANEAELTRVKSWVENSALELAMLLRHFGRSPAALPATKKKTKPLPLYSLAASLEANIASDIAVVVVKLSGSPATVDAIANPSAKRLWGSIAKSQISLAASMKATLLTYDVPVLPFPLSSSPPYADEASLLGSIVSWLTKQSEDLKALLNVQRLTPGGPPEPLNFANVNLALSNWEQSLAKMAQDFAYVASQHPRHLMMTK